MGGRRGTLILVGAIVVLVVLFLVLFLLRGRGGQEEIATATPEPVTTQIVVAVQTLPRGAQILSGTVGLYDWPIANVPPGALVDINEALGQYVRFDIPAGLPILPGMVAGSLGEVTFGPSDLPLKIAPGKVAIAVPVNLMSSVAYAIRSGDHVDVLASFWVVELDEEFQTRLINNYVLAVPGGEEGRTISFVPIVPGARERNPMFGYATVEQPSEKQRPRLVAQLTVQNAVVLGVGDWLGLDQPQRAEPAATGQAQPTAAPATGPEIITLIVDPQDALVLKFLRESGATVDMVLRSAGDTTQTFSTESVTVQYMFARFQVAEPPKLPYGIIEAPTPTPVPKPAD